MLKRFRTRLADVDALPQLAILGLLAGGVIILFRSPLNTFKPVFYPVVILKIMKPCQPPCVFYYPPQKACSSA